MDKVKEWTEQLKDRWQMQSSLKKMIVVLSVISVLGVTAAVYYLNTRIEYGILFTDLSDADAGTISKDLEEQQIAYKLADNGTTILIDKDQVDEYRINLAVDNKLPNTSTGFELFDDANMMTTDEDRKIMYQRAVTGELQRAIESIDAVKSAKVLLVMPEESVFSSEESAPTASIVLTLKNQQISDESVQGIVTLTSGAVEKLKPENVKVVDSAGNTLTRTEDEASQLSGLNNKYIAIKDSYEKTLEEKVAKLLTPIYGADKFQVSINLDLNFDSIERKKVTYDDPEIKSETVQAAGSQGTVQEAQTGTVDDNVSNVTGTDGEGNNSYSRSVENELDTETTTTITAPGMIERMTSSIVINGNLSQADQAELQQLIASAVGYDNDRGDQIAIQGFDFAQAEVDPAADPQGNEPIAAAKGYLKYAIIGGIVLTLFLVILMIVGVIRRRRKEDELEVDVTEEMVSFAQPSAVNTGASNPVAQEVVFGGVGNRSAETKPAVPEASTQEAAAEHTGEPTLDQTARNYAESNPEVAAELIKAWMKEK